MIKKVHIPYYRKLLDQTPLSPRDRKFYESVLASIEKRGGSPTHGQEQILDKIKNG